MLAIALVAAAAAADDPSAWWSYQPIADPAPPKVADPGWCRNGIDHFVVARLEAEGLEPPPEADRSTLIRRATFDLTGLPPSPEEVERFLADDSEGAWAALIDRLLASPQYGEQWGRHWLDLVRYADTNGFERDSDKPGAWRYRDWVVEALNEDKPYDRFLVEQLAGDELPDRTFESMVATGYYRLGMWDDEVPDLKQAQFDDLDGIVDVTARTMLGVGLGCARCHDHKGDPIPQSDYYAFAAYFAGVRPYKTAAGNSIEAANVTRRIAESFGRVDPTDEHAKYLKERAELIAQLTELQGRVPAPPPSAAAGRPLAAHYEFEVARDADESARSIVASSVPGPAARVADLTFGERGRYGLAATFDGGDDRLTLDNPIGEDFTISFWLKTDRIARGSDTDPRWFLGAGLIDGELPGVVDDFGIAVVGSGIVAAGVGHPETFVHSPPGYNDGLWHHVALTREQPTGVVRLFVDGWMAQEARGGTQPLRAPRTLTIGGANPGGGAFSGQLDDIRLYSAALAPREVLSLATEVAADQAEAIAAGLAERDAAEWSASLARLEGLAPPATEGEPILCVVEAKGAPPPMHVLTRGSPHAPAALVEPAPPKVLGTYESPAFEPAHGESTGRRTALARWITDPRNPLTARVAVNRIWQHHFGQGLVGSASDFGHFGEKPTHPELLDWLARRFIRDGWSVKAMHRLIMESAAYRMSSVPSTETLARDEANAFLSRQRMRRVSSEELRDSILSASGTMNSSMGGSGDRPPLPPAVLATSSRPDEVWPLTAEPSWTRRSLYLHQKRSLQDPLLASFDQADIDNTCPVRFTTVQPTQSLILLNGEFANAQARKLADRLEREHPGDRGAQVNRAVELAYGRKATSDEVREGSEFIESMVREGHDDDDARALFALMLLNSNEFLHID